MCVEGGGTLAITQGALLTGCVSTISCAALRVAQALEQRLRDKDEQVDKLTAQLEDSNSRLRYREQEVRGVP